MRFHRLHDCFVITSDCSARVLVGLFKIDTGMRPQAVPTRRAPVVQDVLFLKSSDGLQDGFALAFNSACDARLQSFLGRKNVSRIQNIEKSYGLQDPKFNFVVSMKTLYQRFDMIPVTSKTLSAQTVSKRRTDVIVQIMKFIKVCGTRGLRVRKFS